MNKSTYRLSGLVAGAAFALCFGLGTGSASAQTFMHEGLVYKASGNKLTLQAATVTPENGTAPGEYSGSYVIPEEIPYNGKTYIVTSVGTVFKSNAKLVSLEMPSTITSLSRGAFADCTGLESVKLPSAMTALPSDGFARCSALKEISIPGTIAKADGGNTFKDCTSLEKITFEEGATPLLIKLALFTELPSSLKEVYIYRDLDNSTVAMADKPFRASTSLEKVVLGDKVTALPASFFENCTALKDVTIGAGLETIGTSALSNTAITEIVLPDALKTITASAFAGDKSLVKVTMGKLVKTIESMAFRNTGVTEINFSDSLTTIGDMAFQNSGLAGTLTLPEALKKLGSQAFAANTGLTEVVLGDSLATVGDGPFMACPEISKYTVAADNRYFANEATGRYVTDKDGKVLYFYAPKAAGNALALGVTEIKPYACYGATALENVDVPSCATFGDYAFASSGIKSLTVKGSVGRYVAQNCPELTAVNIQTTEVPIGIVAGCEKLTSVTLPEAVTVVKSEAFKGTSALKELNLGSCLAIIESGAFDNAAVETLSVGSTYPAVMPDGVFTEAHANITVKVPVDLVDAYKAAPGWSMLKIAGDANIVAGGADMGMPAGLYYAGEDGMLHCVYSDGENDTYDVGGVPHTFQLVEYSNRIYGACAGEKFVYSATGAVDGDGKLFYISKVGGNIFQAVVLDNTGNNAYMDPFGLYIYGEDLYVNDRNVCLRKIPASAISLPQDYPSWMENNWMAFYNTEWTYGCIKAGFAITTAADTQEPLYWLGMKYNGNGIFRFREGNIGTGAGDLAGSRPTDRSLFTQFTPIITTFNVDEPNGHLYMYVVRMGDLNVENPVKCGLYRVNIADVEANSDAASFWDYNPVLIDGAPVIYEGNTEYVGIPQLAIDSKGEYMYWCYRTPSAESIETIEGYTVAQQESNNRFHWADKYDATNPRHQDGIKRIKLGEANPEVETVVPGVRGYGVVAVNYEGSTRPEGGVSAIVGAQTKLAHIANGTVVANTDLRLEVYTTAGLLVAVENLAAGETFAADLEAGVYVAVANAAGETQVLKFVK